jgi:hypothetical protein
VTNVKATDKDRGTFGQITYTLLGTYNLILASLKKGYFISREIFANKHKY